MGSEIILEWDEEKRLRNIAERGVDFAEAVGVLSDPNVALYVDSLKDYGEERFNAYGVSNGRRLRLCFTHRKEKIRVITIFKVHQKEWEKYYGTSK